MITDYDLARIKKRCKASLKGSGKPGQQALTSVFAHIYLPALIAEVERLRAALRACHATIAKLGITPEQESK